MQITELTKTYFSLGSDLRTCGSGGWIAFGNQQWGNTSYSTSNNKTISFPLAFSSNPTAVFSADSSANGEYNIDTISASSFTIKCNTSGSGSILWIAISTQQWGQTSQQGLEFAFPIAFPKKACAIASGADDVDSQANIIDRTTGRVYAYDYGGHRWIAIGYQCNGVRLLEMVMAV